MIRQAMTASRLGTGLMGPTQRLAYRMGHYLWLKNKAPRLELALYNYATRAWSEWAQEVAL